MRICYNKYLIIKKLPISKNENKKASILKYLSIKDLIGSPNFQIKLPMIKNLADLATKEAIKNRVKFILNAPAETVNTLNGIGVKPEINMTQKFHSSYFCLISKKISVEKPGIILKKKLANRENS